MEDRVASEAAYHIKNQTADQVENQAEEQPVSTSKSGSISHKKTRLHFRSQIRQQATLPIR